MVNSDPYEAAALSLREKESRLIAELDAVRKSLAGISAAREAAGLQPPEATTTIPKIEVSPPPPAVLPSKYKGMGLEAASTKVLSESDRIELTGKQIWAALEAAGFTLLSDRPEQSVSWALRKRERKEGDVILVGDGKWGMVSWYSAERLRQLRARRNNASTRNSAEHIEKTKAGIANARKTRLDNWGPRRRITAEQMAAAYHAIRSGAKSKLAAAKAGGMVWPTFNFYWCNYEMERWKPGDDFPPQRRAVPLKSKDIPLKEMWPSDAKSANGHSKDSGPQLLLQPTE
ncbi:MAG: hypothetical protein ABSA90_01095 [Xanthobacteraceae bacterium]|jgi:hypothetical protein